MPRMNGEELRAAIHAVRPDLPRIMMTALGDGLDERRIRGLGFHALLSKPFTLQVLSEICAKAIAH